MTKPQRIQLSRRKGFDLQETSRALNGLPAVNVARPSICGNPFTIADAADVFDCRRASAHRHAVDWFDRWLDTPNDSEAFEELHEYAGMRERHAKLLATIPSLRRHNVACFCRAEFACHGDVLIRRANAPEAAE